MMKKIILLITLIIVFNAPICVKAESRKTHLYLSDMDYVKKEVGWANERAFLKDENETKDLLSLIIDGERTYFLKGIMAHATSTVVYDLEKNGLFDMFSCYVGVDASRGTNGDGVKFYIYGADDYNNKNNWTLLQETDVLTGVSEAEQVEVNIKDYKYLILYAHQYKSNASDHAVYADALLYDSKNYNKEELGNVDFIKKVETYDNDLKNKTTEEILNDDNLELELLQRKLVKKVGYSLLKTFALANSENKEFLTWLFTNKDVLKEYLLGGEPEGGSYYKALTVFSSLYSKFKDDLDDDVYRKTMMAISLAYASDVDFWQTAEEPIKPRRTPSNAIDRYKVIKKLYSEGYQYDGVSTNFDKKLYKKLQIEEMRWVVNNRISDTEIAWLNWFTEKTKAGKTDYDAKGYMDPYSYIRYATGWNYEDLEYYKENSMHCAMGGNANKTLTPSYQRGRSCNEKYGLNHFGLEAKSNSPLRLWIVWEEDGVCGSLAGTGSNIEMSYGKPSTLVSQPAHAAYFVSTREEKDDGTHQTKWRIGNNAGNWSNAYKSERMMLGWGSRSDSWVNTYNGSYLIVSQRAVDNFDQYQKAFMYNLVAEVEDNKEEIYNEALAIQPYNITSWYNLINTYLKDETKTSSDYYQLAQRIMENLKEFPMPMHDLLKLIEDKIETEKVNYTNDLKKLLVSLTDSKNTKNYYQADAVGDVARYLLGVALVDVAKFSFDGEFANKLVLQGSYKNNNSPYEYTLNYSYDTNENKVSDETKWHLVSDGADADLSNLLSELDPEKDIVIHVMGTDRNNVNNLFFIDLTKGEKPKNLYVNDLENKIFNTNDNMEWKIEGSKDSKWTSFTESSPIPENNGITSVLIRNKSHGTVFASEAVEVTFEKDKLNENRSYIPISRLKAKASSEQSAQESASKAIDGNKNTIWHNFWYQKDEERYIEIEIDKITSLSAFDYVPRQDGANGIFTKTKIEVSTDGVNWTYVDTVTWKDNSLTKTYEFEEPLLAKFIRLKAIESHGGYASAAMINLYEDLTKIKKPIEETQINYQADGYVYNGKLHQPQVVITDNEKELIQNKDYSLKYINNVKSGVATIEITGLGEYDGTVEKNFTIAKASYPSILPNDSIEVKDNADVLEEVEVLPSGWEWEKPKTKLIAGNTIEATAIYHNRDDYENYQKVVLVNKNNSNTKTPVTKINNDNSNNQEQISNSNNIKEETEIINSNNNDKEDIKIKKLKEKQKDKENKIIKKEKTKKNFTLIISICSIFMAASIIIKYGIISRKSL